MLPSRTSSDAPEPSDRNSRIVSHSLNSTRIVRIQRRLGIGRLQISNSVRQSIRQSIGEGTSFDLTSFELSLWPPPQPCPVLFGDSILRLGVNRRNLN